VLPRIVADLDDSSTNRVDMWYEMTVPAASGPIPFL
jgi:hypothetical protein